MIKQVDLTPYDLTSNKGLADAMAYLLDFKKGKDVVSIDVTEQTAEVDYFVIASVFSQSAVIALANFVEDELSKCGLEPVHRDREGKWVALDYGSVIMHVFHKDLRDYYQIERLWSTGANEKRFISED